MRISDWSSDVCSSDLHVPGLGFNGTRSLSPLRHALRVTGGVSLAGQEHTGQFFANQARPDYVLRTDKSLDGEQVENLRSQIDEKHGEASGQGSRPMLLQGGLDVKALTLPSKDAEIGRAHVGTPDTNTNLVGRLLF